MEEFLKKWKSDKKFKTLIQLTLYTSFVIIVSIFAISNRNMEPANEVTNQNDNQYNENSKPNDTIIKIPEEYKYLINVNINEKEYKYSGTKDNKRETILKELNETKTNYVYQNNSYYKKIDEEYILTNKDDVYDVVNYNYINLENINEYLLKAEKLDNQYLVYLRDIILDNNSDDYIIIKINNNKINIDYTVLTKHFDTSINNYLVNIEIEEIE